MVEKENIHLRVVTVVGCISVLLLVSLVLLLQAWFYRLEERETSAKYESAVNSKLMDLRLRQEQRIRSYRWIDRKKQYIDKLLEEKSQPALLVCAADKLHNARAILSDPRTEGDGLFERFTTRQEY